MKKGMACMALLLSCGLAPVANAETQTTDPEQLFQQAMQLRDKGEIYHAIELFETLLANQPGLQRARLELAVAYHNARRFEDAREQLNRVLDDPETPETVKLSITAYLAQLGSDEEATRRRTSSSVYVSAGLFTDSNVNLGPSPELANVTATETDGTGMTAMASLSHLSRATKPLQIGERPVDFEWRTQATAYAKAHSGDENDYNVQVLSLNTGPALVDNENWRGALNIRVEKVFFDDNPYSFNIGLNPSVTLNFDRNVDLTFEALTMVREYASVNDELDGTASMYGASLAKFYNDLAVGVEAGMRYHANGAEASHLNYQGGEMFVGGQMAAWDHARIYLQLSARNYDYRSADPDVTGSVPRDETENQAVLGVSHDFIAGALKSWTLNGQLTYTENDANDPLFEYDRTLFEVNMRSYF